VLARSTNVAESRFLWLRYIGCRAGRTASGYNLALLLLQTWRTAQILPKPANHSAQGKPRQISSLKTRPAGPFRLASLPRQARSACFLSRLLVTLLHGPTARVRAAQEDFDSLNTRVCGNQYR